MQKIDLTAYLVLDPVLCEPLGMVETAERAVQGGATVVQLRAPTWKKRALVECGRALHKALAAHGVPLIVNDHVDVALAIGAEGVHVGQHDMAPADVRALMGSKAIVGLSVSTLAECESAHHEPVDYLGVGPVWATTTKPDAAAALGLEGLSKLLAAVRLPHVVIGGINAERLPSVKRAGAQGFAVVSAVCGKPSPEAAMRSLCTLWKNA